MGFDDTPRTSYNRDKLATNPGNDKIQDGKQYARKSPENGRSSYDNREYDSPNYGRDDVDYDYTKRYHHDDHRPRAYPCDGLDSDSNFTGPYRGREEEYYEPYKNYRTDDPPYTRNSYETSDSSFRGTRSRYSSERFPDEYRERTPYRNDTHSKGTHYETRTDASQYPRMSDLDYISRNENVRKYNNTNSRYEDSYKRPRLDGRGYQYDEALSPKYTKARNPPANPNTTLGLFGLNQFTTEDELRSLLCEKLTGIDGYTFKLIVDERTGFCKGFCFIDFVCLNDAISAREVLNTESFRGQDFKCDYSYKHGIMGAV